MDGSLFDELHSLDQVAVDKELNFEDTIGKNAASNGQEQNSVMYCDSKMSKSTEKRTASPGVSALPHSESIPDEQFLDISVIDNRFLRSHDISSAATSETTNDAEVTRSSSSVTSVAMSTQDQKDELAKEKQHEDVAAVGTKRNR